PKKYKHLLELTKSDLVTPHHVWIAFFVCAIYKESCGWGGWMIDSVFSTAQENPPDGLLASDSLPMCPKCGRQLAGTVTWRLDRAENQYPRMKEGVDYTVEPATYENDD